ncbi:hypothetical protein GXP67_14650 [Rhodocytophaga rosea]|uniref:DUF2157 domain-containing protein n=1 Tax=Rhodocytophaga rosea TaxID=2704465 RepID=A0A6C0GID1_9BACT|nr:hypothetical protein [Rhodocytophaga rosea]QHT67786.1 hypothetical protein GXP67_14650 [Rhodocytophaga rosea]
MIAYNAKWLDALAVQAQAWKWYKKGWLPQQQWEDVRTKFQTGFYTPNIFVRIGLFIFTWILVSSVFGLFGLTLLDGFDSQTGAAIICMVFSGGCFFLLEMFIKEKKYYQAGIDDALLYTAGGFAISGICLLLEPVLDDHFIFYLLLIFPLLVAITIRYVDRLAALLAYATLAGILFLALEPFPFTRALIPFACLVFSGVSYFQIKKIKQREELRYWLGCLEMAEACSLVLFYMSGNYFVVTEVGEMLFPGYALPFSILVFILTALIPLVYVYAGLKNFDRLLLRLGLIMIALSVLTFKYYFSLGHHEVTLTIAGAIMVGIAYGCIRYLKKNPTPYTYQEDISDETPSFSQAESLIHAQTFGPSVVPEKDFDFGGGKFGGGGAGGQY